MDSKVYADLRIFYDEYIKNYSSREMDELLGHYGSNVTVIGGGTDYIIKDLDHLKKEFKNDFEQVPKKIDIQTDEYNAQLLTSNIAVITTLTSWTIPIGDEIYRVKPRIVMVSNYIVDTWKLNHISISVPLTSIQPGEHFPLKEMEERNRVLQELVEQRTKELLAKEENERFLIEQKAILEIANANNQRDILQLELQNIKFELKYKEQELASFALNIASKNECMYQLETKLISLKSQVKIEAANEINQLLSSMKANINIERGWEEFQNRFNEINQAFIKQMLASCPTLTNTEIQVISMLRLQFQPKEIASFKNVTISNINNHIGRIRKKLKLNRGINLIRFLSEL